MLWFIAALVAVAVIVKQTGLDSASVPGASATSNTSAATTSPTSSVRAPAASSSPSEVATPGPSFRPLAFILTGTLPKKSEAGAAASIARMFATYPKIATAFLNGSANIPLARIAPDPFCFAVHDTPTYENNAPQCLVVFQALRQAYRMSGDEGFLAAAADLLGAMSGYMPAPNFSRFETDLRGLSDFLESQSRL